ncbi:MAG: hypothetical protein FJ147_17165 [Deltaproteobacteria bacterium]|nr:hypothetical protein [Deltaproteobacteria bacterium]
MKASVKHILSLAAIGMSLWATTIPTWAGKVSADRVIISSDQSATWATGSLTGARYSSDTSPEQIGCRAYTLSTYSWTSCYAKDNAGRSLTCGSGDWKFLDMVQGMTDSSFIYFGINGNGSTGTCSDIRITNGSDLLK